MTITFIREVGDKNVRKEINTPWNKTTTHWMAEFDTSTTPPKLIGGSSYEWRSLLAFPISRDEIIGFEIIIDEAGNVVESCSGKVIMQGPPK